MVNAAFKSRKKSEMPIFVISCKTTGSFLEVLTAKNSKVSSFTIALLDFICDSTTYDFANLHCFCNWKRFLQKGILNIKLGTHCHVMEMTIIRRS